MYYYLKYRDKFVDENSTLIPDVNDICRWYFCGSKNKKYNLRFTEGLESQQCKRMFDSIYDYTVNRTDNTVAHTIGNIALNVFKVLTKDEIARAYIPVVSSKGFAGYIHLITVDNVVVDTAFTRDKFKATGETLEYYRLKLGLLYYLLDIEKDFGYLMHISAVNGIKRQYIENVYDNAKCESIIDAYMAQNKAKRKADIGKADILLYQIYNAPKRLKLPLN